MISNENPNLMLSSFDQDFYRNPDDESSPKEPLTKSLLRGIYSVGFNSPTEVQQHAIIPLTIGRDVIIQAQSGTGKTGAFTIGSLARIEPSVNEVQVLVLAPTVSLARQTGEVMKKIGHYLFPENDDWLLTCYGGGTPFEQEVRLLKTGKVRVIVGTTGRVAHLMRERCFGQGLKMVIFDEADNILEERFLGEVQNILYHVPKTVQIGLFSATMSESSLENARKLVRNDPPYIEILLAKEQLSLAGIKQYKIMIEAQDHDQVKLAILDELYKHYSVSRCIIFTNSRKRAEWLGQYLKGKGYSIAILHGDLPREERAFVEASFRTGESRILISSDLLSRGFDVQDLQLVINFDVPAGNMALETYIHRVGRTGRYGRKGLAISLVRTSSGNENQILEMVNQTYGGQIEDLPSNVEDVFSVILGT